MKKLIIILILSVYSLGAMSMGFSHNTYTQERLKANSAKKLHLNEKIIKHQSTKVLAESNETTVSLSFVEMIVNYVVKLFFYEVVNDKSVVMNYTKQVNTQLEAIKNEYDIIIG